MKTFSESYDGKWFFGGSLCVDPESYARIHNVAMEWGISDRAAANSLLRSFMTHTPVATLIRSYIKENKHKDWFKDEQN